MALLALLAGLALGAGPVYPPEYGKGDVESLKQSVADAMALSPEELYALVPACSGIYFCGCPHCDGGAQEHAMTWELGMGDTVACRYCGMQFPNEQYPNNREKVVVAPSGASQVYRWYENDKGRQYFFEARAWYERWQWTRTRALELANLFALTDNAPYGDRAAAIVGRYAQVYPDYAIRFDYPFLPVRFWPADQKWPYDGIAPFRGAKFYWWAYGDIPVKLARAYDLVRTAGNAFERMQGLLGEDIQRQIEDDLIRLGYEFVAANPDNYGNMSPGVYTDMVVAGRILGAPEMVHEAVKRFETLIERQFYMDGWWREAAPSYHWQTVGNLRRVVDAAKGYSDPPDWPEPRFEDLDLASRVPMLPKAHQVGCEGCLPNGRLMPVNDTWWFGTYKPLDASVCRLWAGMGHAVLGAGKGDDQFQVHINWGGAFGHTHMDSGAILLFARGKELLSDIGYTHTRYRNWTINSASHNLVVVDQRSQPLTAHSIGNLRFYDDSYPHVHVVDVDVRPAYPGCSVYRRRLVHVHVDKGRDYVVDCFDVAGGACHDYFLHGCADEEGSLDTSVAFDGPIESLVPDWGGTVEHTGENSLDVSGEKHHAYMFFWNVRRADSAGPWSATWRYGAVGLKTFLAVEPGTTLYRFQAPSVRRARDDDAKLDDYLMNGIMQRHEAERSRFMAVHVPFEDTPWVDSVSFDNGVCTIRHGGIEATVTLQDARVHVASSEGWSYDSGEPVSGRMAAAERDGVFALRVETTAPEVDFVRVDFGGTRQTIYRVTKVVGDRLVLEDDPGFTYDPSANKARFVYFPHETFDGPLTWTVWKR